MLRHMCNIFSTGTMDIQTCAILEPRFCQLWSRVKLLLACPALPRAEKRDACGGAHILVVA